MSASVLQYAKFIVAIVGAAVTSLLATVPPATTMYEVLTVLSAVVTAAAVYFVPNGPAPVAPAPAPKA